MILMTSLLLCPLSFSRSYWTPSLSLSFSYVSLSLCRSFDAAAVSLALVRLNLFVVHVWTFLCMFWHVYVALASVHNAISASIVLRASPAPRPTRYAHSKTRVEWLQLPCLLSTGCVGGDGCHCCSGQCLSIPLSLSLSRSRFLGACVRFGFYFHLVLALCLCHLNGQRRFRFPDSEAEAVAGVATSR